MCLPGRAASIGATFLSATGKTKPAVALRRAGYSFRSMISSENRFSPDQVESTLFRIMLKSNSSMMTL